MKNRNLELSELNLRQEELGYLIALLGCRLRRAKSGKRMSLITMLLSKMILAYMRFVPLPEEEDDV